MRKAVVAGLSPPGLETNPYYELENQAAAAHPLHLGSARRPVEWSVAMRTCIVLGIALYIATFAVPLWWMFKGRHYIRDNWNPVNCTVMAQSCYKKCTWGHSRPNRCCSDAEDCARGSYFMSQNCVWLSASSYEHMPDFTARERDHTGVLLAPEDDAPSRIMDPAARAILLIGSVALMVGSFRPRGEAQDTVSRLLGLTAKQKKILGWVLFGLWLLLLQLPAAYTLSSSTASFELNVTVQLLPPRANAPALLPSTHTRSLSCAPGLGLSELCAALPALSRPTPLSFSGEREDLACDARAEHEDRAECELARVNQNGQVRTCYADPATLGAAEVQVEGSKGVGVYAIATLAFCASLTVLAATGLVVVLRLWQRK